MGRRMFVAVVPPADVREDLAAFLDPRAGLSWTPSDRLHLTLAFLPDVHERVLEPLDERLRASLLTEAPFECRLAGAGAFPNPDRPAVLWVGIDRGRTELQHLARRVRGAANTAGAFPDGQRFVPHLTLARPPRNRSAIRWLRVLDTYVSRTWTVDEVSLVESQPGGRSVRPRHVEISVLPLGG